MRDWISWPLLLGLALGAALLLVTGKPVLLPVSVLLALVLPVLHGWTRERALLAARYRSPLRLAWTEAPAPQSDDLSGLEEELGGLGYSPAGVLESGKEQWRVYLHRELPIYAFLIGEQRPGGRWRWTTRLETFYEEGGRLTSTGSADYERYTTDLPQSGPRLVQLRVGGTPTALDGQHVGTVRAWAAGKRAALPATRDALPGYLEADHEHVRERLERRSWLPLSGYLRALLGRPARVLRF